MSLLLILLFSAHPYADTVMMLKGITTAVAACAVLVTAQTFTDCNPLEKGIETRSFVSY